MTGCLAFDDAYTEIAKFELEIIKINKVLNTTMVLDLQREKEGLRRKINEQYVFIESHDAFTDDLDSMEDDL